jgi:hypothetical protein
MSNSKAGVIALFASVRARTLPSIKAGCVIMVELFIISAQTPPPASV